LCCQPNEQQHVRHEEKNGKSAVIIIPLYFLRDVRLPLTEICSSVLITDLSSLQAQIER
jgi:hypothetical protein